MIWNRNGSVGTILTASLESHAQIVGSHHLIHKGVIHSHCVGIVDVVLQVVDYSELVVDRVGILRFGDIGESPRSKLGFMFGNIVSMVVKQVVYFVFNFV